MQRAMTLAAGVLFLAACSSGASLQTGAIPGANSEVVEGSPVATGSGEPTVGAVEGGLMGSDVGESLNDADREVALKAEYEALEYGRPGQSTQWRARKGDNRGEIRVGTTYQVNRLDCREYTHNVWIGGRLRVVHGTACRQPDGAWRILG